jgi:hypothetical protein
MTSDTATDKENFFSESVQTTPRTSWNADLEPYSIIALNSDTFRGKANGLRRARSATINVYHQRIATMKLATERYCGTVRPRNESSLTRYTKTLPVAISNYGPKPQPVIVWYCVSH